MSEITFPKERPITTEALSRFKDHSESAIEYGKQANCGNDPTVIKLEPESVLKALASAEVIGGFKTGVQNTINIPVTDDSTNTEKFLHNAFNILNEAKKLNNSLFTLISKVSSSSNCEKPRKVKVQEVLAALAA